jgi:hypothetical protein
MTAELTTATTLPVTPEYAESLGFVPSYVNGMYFVKNGNVLYYLQFRDGNLVSSFFTPQHGMPSIPQLPTRYNLARLVEEFTKGKE